MEWTEIERTSKGLESLGKKSGGHAIYSDHLLVFKNHNTDGMFSKKSALCCWNISI